MRQNPRFCTFQAKNSTQALFNLLPEWSKDWTFHKVTTTKNYLYDDKLVRQIQINLSIEISQTFIFWSVWSNLLNKRSILLNFALCPLVVVFIKRELFCLSLKESGFICEDLTNLTPTAFIVITITKLSTFFNNCIW